MVPVVWLGCAAERTFQTVRYGLDGRERVVDLVTDHPDQALPGLALFVPEGSTHVREHQQVEGQTTLAERLRSRLPSAASPWKRGAHRGLLMVIQKLHETEPVRLQPQDALRRPRQQCLSRPIDQP